MLSGMGGQSIMFLRLWSPMHAAQCPLWMKTIWRTHLDKWRHWCRTVACQCKRAEELERKWPWLCRCQKGGRAPEEEDEVARKCRSRLHLDSKPKQQAGPWRGVAHGRARTLVKRKPVLTPGGSGSGERVCVAGPPPGILKNACQMQPAACASCRLGGVRIVRCTALRVHASCHKR